MPIQRLAGLAASTLALAAAPAQASPPPSFADMAAHREAIAERQWRQARKVAPVPLAVDGGIDWPSVLIGGSVPLSLLLFDLGLRPPLRRRVR